MSKEKTPQDTPDWRKNLVLYLHDVICYLIVIVVLFLLVFRVVIVSGTSMNMTLYNGDYLLLLSNTFYRTPKSGDVVVISKDSFDNGAPIVKRVIATAGETVDIDFETGVVYVNGTALKEDYVNTPTNTRGSVAFPITIPEGCIFVMGDNRNGSRDSRYAEIGLIDTREVLGKAILLFLPGTNTESDPRPRDYSRIGVID